MMEVQYLSIARGRKKLFSDLCFSIKSGESLAVLGPNGAGKSSLLQCLTGNLKPDHGEILINAVSVHEYKKRSLARVLSYLPQNIGALPALTVTEYLHLSRYAHGCGLFFSSLSRQCRLAIEEATRICRISDFLECRITELSAGQAQRVHLAATLAQSTNLLLLDEPTSSLDPQQENLMFAVLGDIKAESGKSLIIVSHKINACLQLCERVLALSGQNESFLGSSNEFLSPERLKSIYGGRFAVVQHPQGGKPLVVALHEEHSGPRLVRRAV